MAKSFYGPGSTGASVPVAASQWTGGYTPQQLAAGMGPQSMSLGRTYGGFDYSQNRPTAAYTDVNATGGGGGLFGPAQGGGAGGGDAALEAARQRALGSLDQGSAIFRGSLGQAASGGMERRALGQDQPYDQGTQDRMFAAAADQSNAASGQQDSRIRNFFANNGMAGSGGQLRAQLGIDQQHAQNMQAARSEIQNRAQLENFGARERAGEQAGQFLGAQSSGEAPYRLKEADLLSKYDSVGQDNSGNDFLKALGKLLGGQGNARQGSGMGFDLGGYNSQPQQAQQPRAPKASPASYSAPASGAFRPTGPAMYPGAAFGGYSTGSQQQVAPEYQQGGVPYYLQAPSDLPLDVVGGMFSPAQAPQQAAPYGMAAPARPAFNPQAGMNLGHVPPVQPWRQNLSATPFYGGY